MDRRRRLIMWGVFLALLVGYLFVEADIKQRERPSQGVEQNNYIVSRSTAPLISMGFQNLWADFVLLQAQFFYNERRKYRLYEDGKQLRKLIELVFTLDPRYTIAARFANFALGESWREMGVADANELLEMAWKLNPDEYRLPMYIGYNYFLSSHNAEQVVKWMKIALRNPEAPRRLLWIVEEAEKGRFSGYGSLRHIICTQCEQAEDATQKKVFCTRCRLYSILVQLEQLRERYEQQQGRPLDSVRDLVSAGYLRHLPSDPLQGEWVIMRDGRINSSLNLPNGEKNQGV